MEYRNQDFKICRKQIGHNLRALRQMRKLSLEALSEKSGVELIYIHRMERGRSLPTLDVLFQLACQLDTRIERLFEGAGPV